MKSYILKITFLLLLISATAIKAQEQELEKIEIGVKGGLNISDLYTTDNSLSDMIFGFNAGVYLKLPISKNIAIQPELYASTKGATIRFNSLLLDGTARFDLTYIELPVLCVIRTSRHISFHIGPYVSCLVDANVKNMININLFDYEKNVDTNQFNRVDAGIVAGAEVIVHSVTVGISYNYGFLKVGKERTFLGNSYTIPNTTNGVISLYMAVPFYSN
jgi:hypothetical protein